MSEIRSKVHQGGHKHESSWPSQFGTLDTTPCYVDPETKEVKEGYPPKRFEKHGQAPYAIMDSMPKTYHEGVGREIESRTEWEMADKQCNTITFSSADEVRRHTKRGVEKEKADLKADRRKASIEATREYRENPKQVKDRLRVKGEEQVKQLKKAGLTKELKKMGIDYD